MSRIASRLPAAAAAVAAATVIAACGTSSTTSSATRRPPTQAQLRQAQQAAVQFAGCMRLHGVPNFPDPTSLGEFKQSLAGSQRTPAFVSAQSNCQHLLLSGPSSESPAQRHTHIVAALAFARCLRSHGLSRFPDPTSDGQLTHEMVANAGINVHQPAVVQAADACVSVTHGVITKAIVARFVAGQ